MILPLTPLQSWVTIVGLIAAVIAMTHVLAGVGRPRQLRARHVEALSLDDAHHRVLVLAALGPDELTHAVNQVLAHDGVDHGIDVAWARNHREVRWALVSHDTVSWVDPDTGAPLGPRTAGTRQVTVVDTGLGVSDDSGELESVELERPR